MQSKRNSREASLAGLLQILAWEHNSLSYTLERAAASHRVHVFSFFKPSPLDQKYLIVSLNMKVTLNLLGVCANKQFPVRFFALCPFSFKKKWPIFPLAHFAHYCAVFYKCSFFLLVWSTSGVSLLWSFTTAFGMTCQNMTALLEMDK